MAKKNSKKKPKKTIKEIPSKIKQIKEENIEKILEDETQEIQTEQFRDFMGQIPISEFRAPVLEKVETFRGEAVNLEENIDFIQTTNKDESQINYTSNQPNYSMGETGSTKVKYQTNVGPPVLTPRETELPSQHLLNPEELWNFRQTHVEPEVTHPEFNVEERKRMPFEKQERKYKDVRFDKQFS